ncbi:hypothetical protein [Methanolapillus millepedarum]
MKKSQLIIVSLCFLFLLGVFLVSGLSQISSSEIELPPIATMSSNGTFPYYSYEELSTESDLIILGKVVKKEDAKWGTPTGEQPEGVKVVESKNIHGDMVVDYYMNLSPGEGIYTDITISVEKCYKGNLEPKEVVVRSFGGTVGSFEMNYGENINPQDFREGDELLLYLIEDEAISTKDIGSKHYVFLSPMGKLYLKDNMFYAHTNEKLDEESLLSLIKQ